MQMKTKLITMIALAVALAGSGNNANAQKTTKLFNGKNLSNWSFVLQDNSAPAEQVFTVRNGLIRITGKPTGFMYTKENYSNYKLHVEWRWPDGVESNSGIFLLITEALNPFPNGIECQLHAGDAGDYIAEGGSVLAEYKLAPGEAHPKFMVVKKAGASSEKPAGQWNEANIFVRGGVMTTFINGVYQNVGVTEQTEGHIGLQSEGNNIEFRNVTITPFD